jgi:3-hydroxybutyryl-CoA dehydrogenase
MTQGDLKRVGVVGCGLMGAGIAEVLARAEIDVVIVEASAELAGAGERRIEASLRAAAGRGKISDTEVTDARSRMLFSTTYDDLADRELVIEAVTESEAIKTETLGRIDFVLESEAAIIASNTSSIPIMKLGMATCRADRVVGLHFFNPVPVLPLVEIVSSLLTSEHTVDVVRELATTRLGKHVIHSQDRAGFIVNALLIPYLLSAIRMLESGFASAEDIDTGMVQGCAHPMGPLALADLIGLDTTQEVAVSMFEEFKEPLYAPPPLLSRMVDAGLLGRKTGRGFYEYNK